MNNKTISDFHAMQMETINKLIRGEDEVYDVEAAKAQDHANDQRIWK
jgi:hypothetical protein